MSEDQSAMKEAMALIECKEAQMLGGLVRFLANPEVRILLSVLDKKDGRLIWLWICPLF